MTLKVITLSLLASTATVSAAQACTTIAWNTEHGVINTRTFDWLEASNPNLETFYAGEKRMLNGNESYTVKNDFIAITAYEDVVAEGVNKHKLHVNALYYGPQSSVDNGKDSIGVNQFALTEYFLSEFSSVEDVVSNIDKISLKHEQSDALPVAPTLHYSLTDASGDRLIIEHDEDGIKLYRGDLYEVMTNQPSIEKHQQNWKPNIDLDFSKVDSYSDYGNSGRINPEDRYLHANYFLNQLEEPSSAKNGMLKLASIAYNVPHDANNKKVDGQMAGYATEYQITIDVTEGSTVFQYKWGDIWTHQEWNMYDLLAKGKKIKIDLDT
ncbi:linear amide C-N hydrolase [Vibrio crassostreae]|uniref:linear amide C-N hydrolase n=1 Tax=Vibrio crassostreae TaxID=246167 RepID=UPI001050F69F|nr:linear amide C-N hydrolase [Vibrio crassostreae]TCN91555.1 choloylglycine hydrolase [Vibrio crassostreae]CAK2016711.1 Choloylglycine hydrolase [Vibrio crassostreae]CAK2022637.1 Choloylglycine hydrolase [Vibrio crassostreae]CAK2057915.1 Choloylglycine hydrolase [Vibrio crassostreae]CAK2066261.1 Choloylglycine hydrolase [Vibrio crassostreae]